MLTTHCSSNISYFCFSCIPDWLVGSPGMPVNSFNYEYYVCFSCISKQPVGSLRVRYIRCTLTPLIGNRDHVIKLYTIYTESDKSK